MDIYSTSFTSCRMIYPLTIIQPVNRFPVPYREYLQEIINDLHSSNCQIAKFIGDNPKRAIVREALNHASHFACEYCTSKARRTEVISKSETDIASVNETINYLQNLSSSSSMANIKEKHLKSLIEIKKKCLVRVALT